MKKQDRSLIVAQIQSEISTDDLKKLIKNLNFMISHHEKFKNSYFWTPPACASGRRSYEEYNSESYIDSWFKIDLHVKCSCKNIYYSAEFYVNETQINCGDLKKFVQELSSIPKT